MTDKPTKFMRIEDAEDTWLAALCLSPAYAETSRVFIDHLTNRGRRIYQAITGAADAGFEQVGGWKLAEALGVKPDDPLLRTIPERLDEPEAQTVIKRAEASILDSWSRDKYRKATATAAELADRHGVEAGQRHIAEVMEEIRASTAGVHWYKPGEVARELLKALAKKADDDDTLPRTGWDGLDKALDYFPPGRCTIVGGFTGDGKSTLVGQMLTWLALRGVPVARIDLEDEPKIPVQRQLAMLSTLRDAVVRMDSRQMTPEDQRHFHDDVIVQLMDQLPFHGTHMPGANGDQVTQAIYEAGRKHGARVVGVDYIQECAGRGEKKLYLPAAMTSWKKAATDIGAHLFVASQLVRPKNQDPSAPPNKWMLKESGDIENKAEGVLLVHRPEKGADYNGTEPMRIILDKSKTGVTGTLECVWSIPFHQIVPVGIDRGAHGL